MMLPIISILIDVPFAGYRFGSIAVRTREKETGEVWSPIFAPYLRTCDARSTRMSVTMRIRRCADVDIARRSHSPGGWFHPGQNAFDVRENGSSHRLYELNSIVSARYRHRDERSLSKVSDGLVALFIEVVAKDALPFSRAFCFVGFYESIVDPLPVLVDHVSEIGIFVFVPMPDEILREENWIPYIVQLRMALVVLVKSLD
jgi:hypothetical protein